MPSQPAGLAPERSLAHLPVSLFASSMGLGGLSLAYRRAARVWLWPDWPALLCLALSVLAFLVLSGAYLAKWARHPRAARAELGHPIRMAFVPTVTIGLLVIATAAQDLVPHVARTLWWVGALGHLTATVVILSAWFRRPDIGLAQVTPAWFIPVVGNIVTPLAAPQIGNLELAWFAFGVGVFFWVGFLPLVLYRVVLTEPGLPPRLLPTLAIFVAPSSVALLSWQALTGAVADPLGRILFAAAIILAVLVLAQWPALARISFAQPYWAYTFPLASLAVAAIAMAGAQGGVVFTTLAGTLLALATLVIIVVTGLTIQAAARGELLRPEG